MRWSKRPGWIIALIVIFFPVGLMLMWLHSPWRKRTKWIVTGVVAALFLLSRVPTRGPSKPLEASTAPTQATAASTEPSPTQAPSPTPTEVPPSPSPTPQLTEEQIKALYRADLDVRELANDVDKYKDWKLYYEGNVLTIFSSGGTSQVQVKVSYPGAGPFDLQGDHCADGSRHVRHL